MAISATISAPLSVLPANYMLNCQLTISNSGANAITIKQIRPQIKSTPITFLEDKSSWQSTIPGAGGLQVPAGGSVNQLMQVIFFGANNQGSYDVPNPNNVTYSLGAIIYAADGSVTSITPITVTVTQNSQEI